MPCTLCLLSGAAPGQPWCSIPWHLLLPPPHPAAQAFCCCSMLHRPLAVHPCSSSSHLPHCPCRYVGTDSVYTLTTPYERDDKCPICSAGVGFEVQPGTTLQQVRSKVRHPVGGGISQPDGLQGLPHLSSRFTIAASAPSKRCHFHSARHPPPPPATPPQVIAGLMADPDLGKHLSAPSVSYGSTNLYMRGALEAQTRVNLEKVSAKSRGGPGCCVACVCAHIRQQLHRGSKACQEAAAPAAPASTTRMTALAALLTLFAARSSNPRPLPLCSPSASLWMATAASSTSTTRSLWQVGLAGWLDGRVASRTLSGCCCWCMPACLHACMPACLHAQLWGLVPVSLGMAPLGQEQRRAYASAFTETEQMSLGVSVDAVRVHTALPCDCSHEGAAQVWQRRQQRRHGTLSGSRAAAK